MEDLIVKVHPQLTSACVDEPRFRVARRGDLWKFNEVAITFDTTRADVIVVTFSGPSTDADFEAYFAAMERRMRSAAPCAYVMDARTHTSATNAQIRRQGLWMKEHHNEIVSCCRGLAFVFDSPALRFVLSSVFLVHRPPTPYMVTRDMPDAMAWARGQVQRMAASAS